jgi:uncharacterized RmlC-like cupin family protein
MKKPLGFLVAFVVLCGIAGAQETKPMHVLMAPADLKWGDPPPVFEKGMSFAVVSGDPSKPGVFVVMAKVPAGYKINPHWHPTDENVTVLSGTFALGMGEKMDAASMKELPAGGFALLPAKMPHYAMAKTEATIQINAQGPFALTYVNPADDPSKRAPAK